MIIIRFLVFLGVGFNSARAQTVSEEINQPKRDPISLPLGHVVPNEAGIEFLKENKKRSDVIALPSGVQYRVERAGLGMSHPLAHSHCKIHYGE